MGKHQANPAKPIELRQETWDWVLSLRPTLAAAPEQMGPILWKLGIYHRPELLQDTVIELAAVDDKLGVEYVIPRATADALASSKDTTQLVELIRLYDREVRRVPIRWVQDALKNGPLFDQITKRS
jgi:hypothetical protein